MPKKYLTAAYVARIRPPEHGQQVEHFDLGFPGLALRVSYAGAKTWRFSYRIGGVARRLTLGTWPAVGLVEARELWRAARLSIATGIDPGRGGVSRRDTVTNSLAEWLVRDKAGVKASTLRQIKNLIAHDLLPAWGPRRVDSITKRDVLELLDSIIDRGAHAQARAVFAQLTGFFGWCAGRELIARNPMTGLKRPGVAAARDRVLTDAELTKIWNACDELGAHGAAVRLLILTGARREEVSQLRWSEIDGATVKLAADRTKTGKPHTIALSAPARALLDGIDHRGEFVFTLDGKNPIGNWSRSKKRLDEITGVDEWRLHDCRRTCATGLQRLGVNLQVIESVLGHTAGSRDGVVGVYQRHQFLDEARAALEAWASHIVDLVEGRELEPAKVLPLGRRRASSSRAAP